MKETQRMRILIRKASPGHLNLCIYIKYAYNQLHFNYDNTIIYLTWYLNIMKIAFNLNSIARYKKNDRVNVDRIWEGKSTNFSCISQCTVKGK